MRDYVKLVGAYKAALESFNSSNSKFRVIETITSANRSASVNESVKETTPRTLFILDSSFNPPTIAHASLARSAFSQQGENRYEKPYGLLLLLSTTNADKAPKPAAFHERLAMMTLFGEDLMHEFESSSSSTDANVPISIGVTTAPYYADKSAAIAAEGSASFPGQPSHVHLLGFDTLTRFFTAKYYKDFDPPFSALNPFFDAGHRLRVTLRPEESSQGDEDQYDFVRKIGDGSMEREGAHRKWTEQIDVVPPNKKTGVSSTKIRSAASKGDWQTVSDLCTVSVYDFIQASTPYVAE